MNIFAGFTAFFLGALHALEPGHGKSAIAAYAVGYRGNYRHVIFLGLTTAIAHTATILILAFLIGAALSNLTEESSLLYVEMGSAFLLIGTGIWLWRRARVIRRSQTDCSTTNCGCHQESSNTDIQPNEKGLSYKIVGLLGLSIGFLPCPTALAVLINAMAIGHFAGGILTVCLFSVGIALTMSMIAISAIFLANSSLAARLKNFSKGSRWSSYLPVLSAWVIIASGIFTFLRSIYH